MKESWHRKVIRSYKDEVVKAAITALVAAVASGLIYFFLGHGYEWRQANLPEPTLTLRLLSGLVFDSLGAILYELKFYYVLYMVMVVMLRMRTTDYDAVKKFVWYILMFVMGFYIVPWIMDVLNVILAILLNAAMILLYASPFLGIFVVVFLPTFYFLKWNSDKAAECAR